MPASTASPPSPAPVQPAVVPAATRPPAPASSKPAWQRNALFRFLASVKLAVVLLAILIVASIAGTLYETTFNADVARAYVYGTPWFNAWLVLLAVNLAAAAFSRWPWQQRHTGFLITHLGIIILLAGALLGRFLGIEGTITLFKNRPPDNQLIVQQRQLYLQEGGAGGTLSWPVNVIGRRPSAARPWRLGQTPAGWTVELVDYAPLLAADFEPAPVPSGGQPAVRVRLFSKRLNRTMESWLLVGSEEHAAFDLGMASVQLRAGRAPATPEAAAKGAVAAANDIDESIFAFAHKPGQQVAQPAAGKAGSGAKVRLVVTDSARQVHLDWRGATWDFDVEADRGKDQDLSGSGLTARIEDYWPDFLMKDGQPTSASNEPREPAVLVRIFGQLAPDPEADSLAAMNAPSENGASSANQATIYCDAASGALTYVLKSGATPQPVVGALTAGGPGINTGWADWQLSVDQSLPSATDYTAFHPVEGAKKGPEAGAMAQGNHTEGLRVRLSKPGSPTVEEWVPAGWQVALPTGGSSAPTQLSYGWRCESLPIGLQLLDFEIERGEGSDAPAGFKSTLRVIDNEGRVDSGQCWMNNPHNYPGHWWSTFTGLTFKMSQASYNPENPNESTIQILRDPGWLLKWIGSLLVCAGIFTLFYLRPHPVFVEGKAPSARGQKSSKSQARSSKQAQINPSSKKT